MSRRRFVQDPETFELVEVFADHVPDRHKGDAMLWGDRGYDGMSTTDGIDISSRTKHRRYLRQHGLATFDDYKGEFERRKSERESYYSGQKGTINKRDIQQAIDQLNRG